MIHNYQTPFGAFTLEFFDGFVTSAYFDEATGIDCRTQSAENFMPELVPNTSSLQLKPQGTAFQLRVWAGISKIPFGETNSYKQVAIALKMPSAVRAVASAISQNPIACFIPCHRIIRADGNIGGYRWDSSRKKMLLDYEKINSN
jgi:O-6-methylguanine DNA methyltransferase